MKNTIFFYWIFLLLFSQASCSDNKEENKPDPVPPISEIVDGLNVYPQKANASAELKITYKAPKSSALYAYAGDVYAHIGAIDGSEWMYVPATWNENIAKCKMTREADNVWSISLSPTIRQWFGAADGVYIQKIGLVVRSADGSKQTSDLFVPVTDSSFTPSEIVYAPQPAGTTEGINIVDASTVTLVLYDKDINGKYKDYAYVIGDFNDWKIDYAYQMKRDKDTDCWWCTLTGLDSQVEYAFQYYIGSKADGAIRLADAYTEKILDPANDSAIPASTYPNLRKYPLDKTVGIASTFKTQPEAYSWRVADFKVEDKHNLVIYEMLFRDFTTSGDINGAMDKLDDLKNLGVNAIELMPVQEFDGNDSWGYNPCFYFAMDKAYGTREMYKKFIDACHEKGMAVILDVVYNHATGNFPFAKLYWNSENNKTAANNPWFNVDAPHPYSVFHDFNHESPLVRKFVKRNLKFLLDEYKIDGFRFDLTKGFTQKTSTESNASTKDDSRIAILKDYNAAIKKTSPDAIVILEHFAEESEEKELADAGMMLWRNLNDAYCQSAMGWQERSAFTALTTTKTTMPFGSWVGYMESHDEERTSYKQVAYGNYNLKTDLPTRMKQLAVNSALFFTVPGPKMIWQFGEVGYDVSIDEGGRTGRKPVKWDYYNQAARKELHTVYSQLIHLRFAAPELFTASSSFIWSVSEKDWSNGRSLTLKSTTGKALVVVGNFTDKAVSCTATFPETGNWYNYMNNAEILSVTSGTMKIDVPAHGFYVYTNFK